MSQRSILNRPGCWCRVLAEAAQVHHSVRQYLREVEEQNPVEEPMQQQDQVSTTDPYSTYATKGGTPARLGLLRQLSGGQRQLRDCRSAGHSGTHESGNGRGARHAHRLHRVARTRARIGGGRYDVWKRGVLTVVGGSEHHSLYANPRQHPQKEESILRTCALDDEPVGLRGLTDMLSRSFASKSASGASCMRAFPYASARL